MLLRTVPELLQPGPTERLFSSAESLFGKRGDAARSSQIVRQPEEGCSLYSGAHRELLMRAAHALSLKTAKRTTLRRQTMNSGNSVVKPTLLVFLLLVILTPVAAQTTSG